MTPRSEPKNEAEKVRSEKVRSDAQKRLPGSALSLASSCLYCRPGGFVPAALTQKGSRKPWGRE